MREEKEILRKAAALSARAEFVDQLANSIEGSRPAGRGRFRAGLALAMTIAVVGVSASLGGVGYAQSTASEVVATVHHTASPPEHVTVHHVITPDDDEYCHGDDCHHHHHHHHHHKNNDS